MEVIRVLLLGCEEGLAHSHDPKLLPNCQNKQTMSKGFAVCLESLQKLQYNLLYKLPLFAKENCFLT